MISDNFKFPPESMNRVNKLFIDAYEGMVDAQMASLRGYMQLLEDQTRAASAIRDLDGVKGFMEDQPERFNQLVKRMTDDLEQFSAVAEEFRNSATQLFQESAGSDDEPPAPASAGASAKTGKQKPPASAS
ncbi:MAG: phasin family protein [Marinobacter sp.]